MSLVFARDFSKNVKWTQFIITWRPPSPLPSSLLSHSSRFPCLPDRVLIFPLPGLFLCSKSFMCSPKFILSFPLLLQASASSGLGKKPEAFMGIAVFPRRGWRWCQYLCNHSWFSYAWEPVLGLVPTTSSDITSKSWDHSTAFSSPPRFQRILKPCR